MDEVKLFRAAAALVSLYAVIVGAALAWLVQQPLLVFEGAVEGWVSLLAYRVYAFEKPVEVSGFDSLILPGAVLLAYSLLLVATAALVLAKIYGGWGPRLGRAVEAFTGVALASMPALAFLRGVSILIFWEERFLARSYTYETSAGVIKLGKASAHLTPAGQVLLGAPMMAALAVLGVAAMVLLVLYWAAAEMSVVEEEVEPGDEDIGAGPE